MALMLAVAMGPVPRRPRNGGSRLAHVFIAPLPVIGIASSPVCSCCHPPPESNRPFDWTNWPHAVTLFCFMTGLTDGQRELDRYPRLVHDFDLVGGCLHLSQFKSADYGDVAFESGIRLGDGVAHFRSGNFAMAYAVPVFGQLVQGMTPLMWSSCCRPASWWWPAARTRG